MISPPGNTSWSLFFVPVFKWEPVAPTSDGTPPASGACEGGEADTQQPAIANPAPIMRLVLKGYEWRAGWEYVLFPAAPWANCFDCGTYEAREDSAKQESERKARVGETTRANRAQFHPDHHNQTIEPTDSPPASPDTAPE